VSATGWTFSAALWEYGGDASWFFVSLPEAVADEIADLADPGGRPRRGFGSVRVEVTIGSTTWRTSVFPDSKRGTYVLPVKAAVRRSEGLDGGSRCEIALGLVE
jgi:hypothetical protein